MASEVSLWLNGGTEPKESSCAEGKDPNRASTDHSVEERTHLEKCQWQMMSMFKVNLGPNVPEREMA